jgi:hypothetical protein
MPTTSTGRSQKRDTLNLRIKPDERGLIDRAAALDLRMSCLGERLSSVKALTDIFSKAEGGSVRVLVDRLCLLQPMR